MIREQDVVVFQGCGDERSALGPSISHPVFQKYNSAPAGATGANSTADQIWTYNGFTWTKYYYYKRGTTTKWCLAGGTSEIGDDVVIQSAAGFFFVRSNTADATITFAR